MFLEEGSFSFMKQVPTQLQGTTFCNPCYITQIEPALENYNQQIAAAKNFQVYFKNQSKESRLVSRKEPPIKILCDDKDETLVRLAFLAQEAGFNILVDVEVNPEKVRKGGTWQKSMYTGFGIPANWESRKR